MRSFYLFLDWCRASLYDDKVKCRLIYFLISSSSPDEYVHLLMMMMMCFNCSSIEKKCVTTAVWSGTCKQARSFRHRRFDEFLLSLIFRVSCNLAPNVTKKNAVSGLYWWVKKAKKKDIIREFDYQDANAKDNKTYPDKHITNQAVSSWATTRSDSWTTLEMFLLSNR